MTASTHLWTGTSLVYVVAIGSGLNRVIVGFATPGEALAKARGVITHGATDVTIIVSATGVAYSPSDFAEAVLKSPAVSDHDLVKRAEEAVRRRNMRDPRS